MSVDPRGTTARRPIPEIIPGLIDVGGASLASFASGLFAVRYFDPSLLGVYAVFFSAFIAVVLFPTQLVFLPTEVQLLQVERPDRKRGIRRSWQTGSIVAGLAAPLVLLAWIPTAGAVETSRIVPLAVTAVAATVLSPIQDHVRRLQHLARAPWNAAVISSVQVSTAIVGIVAGRVLEIDAVWIPFGALVIANICSLIVSAVLLSRRGRKVARAEIELDIREMIGSGRWLLLEGLLPPASRLLAGALVVVLVGSDQLGFAEAGRVASRPILVAVTGLSAITNPRAMEAGRAAQPEALRALTRRIYRAIPVLGMIWLAVAGFDWPGNPLVGLLPTAYEVRWLTAAMVVASAVFSLPVAERAYLLGSGRVRKLAGIEAFGSVLLVCAAFTAPLTDSFAIPLGLVVLGLSRLAWYQWALRNLPDRSVISRTL